MRDPELVARAGYAAARLEQAWERWRALHGLGGSADPLASYVGYSLKEPMGQPRVVIGVDAAEAEFFADFLDSHDCSAPGTDGGLAADVRPAPGAAHPPVSGPLLPPVSGPQRVMANGPGRTPGFTPISGPLSASSVGASSVGASSVGASPVGASPAAPEPAGPAAAAAAHNGGPGATPAPWDVPSEPMARLLDGTADPGPRPAPLSDPAGPLAAPVGAEYPGAEFPGAGPLAAPTPVTSVFPAIQASLPEYPGAGEPMPGLAEPPDAIAAEMAGWSSGELPGQASEQLASWVAGESGARRLRRSRSAR